MSDDRPNFPPPSPPPTPPDDRWGALARFVAGEGSADERAQVEQWLSVNPADARLLQAVHRFSAEQAMLGRADGITADGHAVTGDYVAGVPVDVEAALQRVRARRDGTPALTLHRSARGSNATPPSADASRARSARPAPAGITPTPAPLWRRPALRAAAALTLVAAGTLTWSLVGDQPSPAAVAATTYQTGIGDRDSIRLADGSVVVLAPQSALVVPANYGQTERSVELRGEGYFDVLHDDAHPFNVHTTTATVRDVGTVFTVREGGDDGVRVSVSEGAVLLAPASGGADAGVVLHQGDVGTLRGGRPTAQRGGASEADDAWTTGRLVFRETPLAEVGRELRRWYGIELRFTDPAVVERHLTTSFDNDPPERVLRVIALALGATIERRGDTAFVSGVRRP